MYEITTNVEDKFATEEFVQLSRRTAKRPIVLYFGRPYFGDNSKYVYLQDVKSETNYDMYWCTIHKDVAADLRKHGLPVLDILEDPQRTIKLFMQAAVAVFATNPRASLGGRHILLACLAGARKIQLWHGISVKHLLLELAPHLSYLDEEFRLALLAASSCDYVLSTAGRFDRFWSRTFGNPVLLRANQPRNEVLVRPATGTELIGSRLSGEMEESLAGPRPKVLLAPTWQRFEMPFTMTADFLEQSVQVAKHGGVDVFFKGHPMLAEKFVQDKKVENLHLIKAGVDIYPHLHKFDALVTDYSSIMFDYLYIDKPILTLDCSGADHSAYEPDWSLVPGCPFTQTFQTDTYQHTLEAALCGEDGRSDARREMQSLIFETDPRDAAATVRDLIAECLYEVLDPPMRLLQSSDKKI